MFNSLLHGVQSIIQQTDDEPENQPGSVILRREQVKMVLFQGKRHDNEDVRNLGML